MCANTQLQTRPGIDRAVEQLLNMRGKTHQIIDESFLYKGINIMIAETEGEKKEAFAVLVKTFKEHAKPEVPDSEELKKLIEFGNQRKMTTLIALMELGTHGTPKKVQRIPLQKATL